MLCAFPWTKTREYATNSCYGVHLDLKSSHDWCALRTYSRFPEPPAKSLPSGHHDLGSMVSGTPNSKCGGVEIRTETTNMTISLKPPLPSHTSFILTDLCAHQSRCNQEGSYFRREHAGANSLWNLRKINQFQATRIDGKSMLSGNLLLNRILRTVKPCESTRLGTLWCAHTNMA